MSNISFSLHLIFDILDLQNLAAFLFLALPLLFTEYYSHTGLVKFCGTLFLRIRSIREICES